MGIKQRIADNTFGDILPWLVVGELVACLKISRVHWRCENETHWTADAESHEDRRRLAWSRHPKGVFAVSVLRRIAVNIQAVERRLSRLGHSRETPTWQDVADHFLLTLCDSTLETEAFDAAE